MKGPEPGPRSAPMASATKTTLRSDPIPDNLLDSVLGQIRPDVLASFNEQQMSSVKAALRATEAEHRHLVRIQGTLPLIFTRLYFLFAVGRDRRERQMTIHEEHRGPRRFLAQLGFLATLGLGLLVAFLLLILVANNLVEADLLEMFRLRQAFGFLKGFFG